MTGANNLFILYTILTEALYTSAEASHPSTECEPKVLLESRFEAALDPEHVCTC
jgi:hypothetical protein